MGVSGENDLVSVAFANNRGEGNMIQGLLESSGIASVLEPTGIDGPRLGIGELNPDGGPQRVIVRADQAEAARTLLAETAVPGEPGDEWLDDEDSPYAEGTGGRKPRNYGLIGAYGRIWLWSLVAMALAFGIFLLLRAA